MDELGLHERRILIADDQAPNVQLLERLLDAEGYSSLAVTQDGAQVPQLCRELNPDLLLLDLHMPGMNGFEVMKELEQMRNGGPYVLVLTADTTPESRRTALAMGASDFVTKPFDRVEVLLRVKNLLALRSLQCRLAKQNELLAQRVDERTSALRVALTRLEDTAAELSRSRTETIQRLARAVEYRDVETGAHIDRMSRYCRLLAERFDLDAEAIFIASPLHDVGKMAVPDEVLLKPGRLDAAERAQMERHAEVGYRLLTGSPSSLLELAATIAWTHHERYDGNGYPRGLAGEDIPLEGRIAGVADVFDALTTDRVYRPAFPLEEALEMLRSERGRHFDPLVLDVFLGNMDEVTAVMHRFGVDRQGADGVALA